jgi:hypothetical protein
MAETEEKRVTLAECEQHTTEKDCWLIIHGKVYDVTDFLDEHPGGYDIVVSASGGINSLSGNIARRNSLRPPLASIPSPVQTI